MANITRKLGEYKATAFKVVQPEGGEPDIEPYAEVTYLATTSDPRHAYPEFKAQGYDVPKTTYVKVEHICTHKYTATLDAFLSVATDEIVEEN